MISQFMHNPKKVHLQAGNMMLQYLKGTQGKGILFKRRTGLVLKAYTDAGYGGSLVDRRSTSGYCVFLVGILRHGEVRNKMWWQDPVSKQNVERWL